MTTVLGNGRRGWRLSKVPFGDTQGEPYSGLGILGTEEGLGNCFVPVLRTAHSVSCLFCAGVQCQNVEAGIFRGLKWTDLSLGCLRLMRHRVSANRQQTEY